jgi:predicted ArsR family transcriptional regulator
VAEFPQREIRDPRILRALTHPVRLRLLDELTFGGPLTATELADRVGESPANCSWHLRQLARYGFVEEAGGGAGRQRPWQIVAQGNTWGKDDDADPELALAGDAAVELMVAQEVDGLLAWSRSRRQEPTTWRDASFVNQVTAWLTVDELAAVKNTIHDLLYPYLERIGDADKRPAGSRPVRVIAWGVPARPLPPEDTP